MSRGRWRSAALPLCGAVLLGMAGCGDSISAPPEGFVFATVSAGGVHTCGVAGDGGVYCWGAGSQGELGDAQIQASVRPVRTTLNRTALDVRVGGAHACAVTIDWQLHCWGWNVYGQLGVGGTMNQGIPIPLEPVRSYRSVAAGWYHTCALDAAGEAFCWGRNDQGQLGTGTVSAGATDRPVRVAGDVRFSSISAGAFHSCGVAVDGRIFCWGLNHLGQLGTGSALSSTVPVPVAAAGPFTQVSAGFTHSCAISAAQQVYCWGSSVHGELGLGILSGVALPGTVAPEPVPGISTVRDVSAGLHVTCAADQQFVYCWGRGEYGQLGLGSHRDHARPQRVLEPSPGFAQAFGTLGIERVSARGVTHTCAVASAGGAYCWGEGTQGQLGTGRTIAHTPQRVMGGVQ